VCDILCMTYASYIKKKTERNRERTMASLHIGANNSGAIIKIDLQPRRNLNRRPIQSMSVYEKLRAASCNGTVRWITRYGANMGIRGKNAPLLRFNRANLRDFVNAGRSAIMSADVPVRCESADVFPLR